VDACRWQCALPLKRFGMDVGTSHLRLVRKLPHFLCRCKARAAPRWARLCHHRLRGSLRLRRHRSRIQCRLSPLRRSQAGTNPHKPASFDEGRRAGRASGRVRVEGDQAAAGGVQCGWHRHRGLTQSSLPSGSDNLQLRSTAFLEANYGSNDASECQGTRG
jgi:hypothetical protein